MYVCACKQCKHDIEDASRKIPTSRISNTSENIALQFTKRTALWSPDLLTDCGPSWVQRGRKNSTLWTEKHCCPALRAIMTGRQISRVSPESAHTHQREAHWPTAWSGWLPNVTKARVRVYTHNFFGAKQFKWRWNIKIFWPHLKFHSRQTNREKNVNNKERYGTYTVVLSFVFLSITCKIYQQCCRPAK